MLSKDDEEFLKRWFVEEFEEWAENYVTLLGGHCGDCGREAPGYLVNIGKDGEVLDGWDDTLPTKVLPFPVQIWVKEIEAGEWDMSCAICGGTVLAELKPGGTAQRDKNP